MQGNPDSGISEILYVERGILDFGVRNSVWGLRNPANDCNLESRFLRTRNPELSTENPKSTVWNPESRTVLDKVPYIGQLKKRNKKQKPVSSSSRHKNAG